MRRVQHGNIANIRLEVRREIAVRIKANQSWVSYLSSPSTSLSHLVRLALILSTLFACASKYLQHVNVNLHAFVQLSSLFSANLML